MRSVLAELVEVDGEQAVMRAFRDNSIPELEPQNIVIPITNISTISGEVGSHKFWVPISFEDPLHFSIDKRYDQHNILGESERPELIDFSQPLTPAHHRWMNNLRYSATDIYKLMGTIAATDLHIDPSLRPKDIDVKQFKKLNRIFEELIGEWGGLLSASVEYVIIGDPASPADRQKQVFTHVSVLIIESEEEFHDNQGKNPVEIFESAVPPRSS